jgi:arylsulfatase A-like enzyme
MTDDHAAHAIGAYGSRVNARRTSTAWRARERSSPASSRPIRSARRAAILTGQYSHVNGVTMFNRFDSSRTTVARLLPQGGYYFWKKDQWELFDLINDPYELHNLYGEPGLSELMDRLKEALARLKREVRDDDRLADQQLPNGVDGTVGRSRGR